MKIVYTGLESSGKSLVGAINMHQDLQRNKYWAKKYGIKRYLYTNMKVSEEVKRQFPNQIKYFYDVKEIVNKVGIDIYHDEIASDFSALKNEPLPKDVNVWLRQGAKQGVIYNAFAQEFHDVHLDWRRRCSVAYLVSKVIGSSRGGKNLPPVDTIWGLCSIRKLDINPYNELEPKYIGFPRFIFINRKVCSFFDTYQFLEYKDRRELEHVVEECKECGYKRTKHVRKI